MSFNYGREEKKWRLWKEAEEKQLTGLGVKRGHHRAAPYFTIGQSLILTDGTTAD